MSKLPHTWVDKIALQIHVTLENLKFTNPHISSTLCRNQQHDDDDDDDDDDYEVSFKVVSPVAADYSYICSKTKLRPI